jgi:hypothetical protein
MKDIWVHDVVHGIGLARIYAELLAAKQPEVTEPVQKLMEELSHVQRAFVDTVMPQLRQTKPNWREISLPHDIGRGITLAIGYAEQFAEQKPQYAETARKFIADIERATQFFTQAVILSDQNPI